MDEDGEIPGLIGAASSPARVSLAAFFTPSRRLSSRFSDASRAAPAPGKKLAWISLQGRLVGAEEATSARSVKGGLSPDEAAAWELLFSPLQRVLIVAVVAVAVAAQESKRNKELKRSVEIRDQVLLDMQQKLDDIFEQLKPSPDQSVKCADKIIPEDDQLSGKKELEFCNCGLVIPQLNPESGISPLRGNVSNWQKDNREDCDKNEISNTSQVNMGVQEERRMSDLSDFSSVTSSVDIQLTTLAQVQDFYNFQKEREEKDATIKELTAAAHASSVASSKRILELEDIIKSKNMVITGLKKDTVVLEQKVIQLARMRRSSTTSDMESRKLPVMANNLLYDMSSSSPSSSDSDTPDDCREHQTPVSIKCDSQQTSSSTKSVGSSISSVDITQKQRSVRPVKGKLISSRVESAEPLRPKQISSSCGELKRTRRRTQLESNCTTSQRRRS